MRHLSLKSTDFGVDPSNFAALRLAEVQVINQFEHFALVAFEDENIVEIRHKPAASLFAY